MAKKIKRTSTALDLKREAFAKAYVANGMNATQAYRAVYPNAKNSTARVNGSDILARADTREHILAVMESNGVSEKLIASKLNALLARRCDSKENAWMIDKGITHARAILGMDAAKQTHSIVDKRELKLSATSSLTELDKIIKRTK